MWAKSSWCLDRRRRTRAGAGGPSGPGKRDAAGAALRWSTDSLTFHPLSSRSALSPPKVSILMTSPLPCSVSLCRATPSPLPGLGRGWEVTTWMSGPCQGDREGQREAGCFLPPPFPWACCAAFVPRLANPFPSSSVCFPLCLISPSSPAPPPPHPQRIEMSAQDMGPICVNPACPLSHPHVPSTRADQCPPLNSVTSLHGLVLLSPSP